MICCVGAAEEGPACARAAGKTLPSKMPMRPASAANRSARFLMGVIDVDFQRLQKTNVLRRHFKFLGVAIFVQNFLVDLDVERFEEAAVVRGNFCVVAIAARET